MAKICSCSLIYTRVLHLLRDKFFLWFCSLIFEIFCYRTLLLAFVNLALTCPLSWYVSMPRMLPYVLEGVSVLHLLSRISRFLHQLPIISGVSAFAPYNFILWAHVTTYVAWWHVSLTHVSTILMEANGRNL